jgi:hypothetical protein
MKKLLLVFSIVGASVFSANAQDSESSGFHFGGGLRLGLPIGDFADGWSFGIGAELQGEYMFSDKFSGTVTTGYTQFMGKDVDIPGFGSVKMDGVGLIPILAGVRVYPAPTFFIGAKVGYGILTGNGNSTGGLNYEPQIGYNGGKFQLALGYNGLSKDGETLSHMGLSAIYKFN